VDTSAWIAFFSRRDQNHKGADRLFRELLAAKRLLLTTNLVLAEMHRLLLHRAGIRAASAALEKIEASPLVRIEFTGQSQHQSAKEWMARLSECPISYADAVSFAVMEASGCTEVLSFDRHFGIAGFSTHGNRY
jgi:predicted nucleic acid-binding protein